VGSKAVRVYAETDPRAPRPEEFGPKLNADQRLEALSRREADRRAHHGVGWSELLPVRWTPS